MSRRKGRQGNRGRDWEKLNERHLDGLQRAGLCVWWVNPQPFRITKRLEGGHFVGRLEGEGPPDFTLLARGRPVSWAHMGSSDLVICGDFKDCARARWSFSQLKEHQASRMTAWEDQGGVAVVLLRTHDPGPIHWVLPWSRLGPWWRDWKREATLAKLRRSRVPSGVASVTTKDLETIGKRWSSRGWLPSLRALLDEGGEE